MSLRIRFRFDGKCNSHPRYDPARDGRNMGTATAVNLCTSLTFTSGSRAIWLCAKDIPEEWYERDREGLEQLVEKLSQRCPLIRKLITDFRRSPRQPLPNWRDTVPCLTGVGANSDETSSLRVGRFNDA